MSLRIKKPQKCWLSLPLHIKLSFVSYFAPSDDEWSRTDIQDHKYSEFLLLTSHILSWYIFFNKHATLKNVGMNLKRHSVSRTMVLIDKGIQLPISDP